MQELDLANEDAKVYKLIGPTLIKQDPVEAKSNVNKRLEFINGELSRLDTRLTAHQDKASKRQQQVTLPHLHAPCLQGPLTLLDTCLAALQENVLMQQQPAAISLWHLSLVYRSSSLLHDRCARSCKRWHGTFLLGSAAHAPHDGMVQAWLQARLAALK